jgi:L-threonylcarbamoyladenylate synthase
MTEVIRVEPDNPDPAAIGRAADCLRRGGLVAFPTETVYGLGVHALDRAAVQRLFVAKQRPATDPLIVHVGSLESVTPLVSSLPRAASILASRFWPGPLTLVLPRSATVPDEVTAGLATVAVRVPVHPVARALIDRAAIPIAAPSANLFSRPSPTLAVHVLSDLDGRIDLVVDGGQTTIGVESTVLDLTADTPTVLRPGAVTVEMLRELLGRVDLLARTGAQKSVSDDTPMPSPGLLEKHYSPRAVLTLYEGDAGAVLPWLVAAAGAALGEGKSVAIIVAEEERESLGRLSSRSNLTLCSFGSRDAPDTVASKLYATLRDLDAAGVDAIFVHGYPDDGLGAAVQDRLRRAAAGRIIRG